uniref:SLX4 interacting protein n=1 Tax=Coturnix japonica TaxID=93934 RepID=A0A8C2Y5R0_COTJA
GSNKDTSWFSDQEKEVQQITILLQKHVVTGKCWIALNYSLRMFPDKFVVCISKLEFNPSDWTCEDELPWWSFRDCKKSRLRQQTFLFIKNNIPFYCSVKRTERGKNSTSKPQTSKDSKKVDLGSVGLQTRNRKNDCQTFPSPQSEVKWRSMGQLKNCINTAESNLEFPVLDSQQKPHPVEQLESRLLSKNSPCSYESALLGPNQNQKTTETQAQHKSCSSEDKCNNDHLGLILEEKTPLNCIALFSKQDLTVTTSDEELVTSGKNLSQPLSVKTNQNEPGTTTEELPVVPSSSYLEMQAVSSGKLIQKRKKEGEGGLRKLKLRRLKKP